jgi:hypothetical protein
MDSHTFNFRDAVSGSDMFYVIQVLISLLFPRLGKPEALTAAAIVTEEHWSLFIPFDKTSRMPPGSPCGK